MLDPKVDLPKVHTQQRENLCRRLTLAEVKNCIQYLPNNKASGPDGSNAEFHKKFNIILINPLFEMLQSLFEAEALPPLLMEANISLVQYLRATRRMFFIQAHINFNLAKVLALRLVNILPSIIANDQTGL